MKWGTTREDYTLWVTVSEKKTKLDGSNPLLQKSPFDQLKDKNLFFSVQVDVGGYGISWNDFIDLSEYELYVNSKEVATI